MAEKATKAATKAPTRKGDAGPKYTPRTEKPRGRRKTRIGYVVSDKMQKTIVVELEDRVSTRSTARSSAPPRRSRRTTRTACRHRRPGLPDGDAPAVGHQALAARRDSREGQVGNNLKSPRTLRRCGGFCDGPLIVRLAVRRPGAARDFFFFFFFFFFLKKHTWASALLLGFPPPSFERQPPRVGRDQLMDRVGSPGPRLVHLGRRRVGQQVLRSLP